jgi:integrase
MAGAFVCASLGIVPNPASKRIIPYNFRHAMAVHLVAAGVYVTVIRSWLSHVSLDTTNHYAQANLKTERFALERLESTSRPAKRPSWQRDQSGLDWLDTL